MRQKRERKTKKLDEYMTVETNEPKHKKIQKNKKTSKKNKDQKQSDQNEHHEVSKSLQNQKIQTHQKNKHNSDKKETTQVQKGKNQKNQMDEQKNNEEHKINKKQKQKQSNKTNNENTITNLAKLNENFKEVKAIYEENLAKCNFHKSQFQQLAQKVNENNMNIQKKAKQLTELSKNIYLEAIRSNRQKYLNQDTFRNSAKLEQYIKNIHSTAQILSNCPYEDPLQKFKLVKLFPQSLTLTKQFKVGQQKKQKVIKEHLTHLPFITIDDQYIPLIQALINSTKYIQKNTSLPIQQFPCLFLRQSLLSYTTIQKSKNILYKIIYENDNKIIKAIHSLIQQQCVQNPQKSLQMISQLVSKGLNKLKFISLPQTQFQLRSFSYSGSIYINTYYIEQQTKLSKQISITYCVFACIRELANFVRNSLIYRLNKNDQDIGKNISEVRQISDFGTKLEKILTGGHQFVCASNEDYNLLCSSIGVKFEKLGKNDNQYETVFVFEEERKRKETITSSLFSKYDNKNKKDMKNKENRNDQQNQHENHKNEDILDSENQDQINDDYE